MKMKKIYEKASIEVVIVNTSDIMTISTTIFHSESEDGIDFAGYFGNIGNI